MKSSGKRARFRLTAGSNDVSAFTINATNGALKTLVGSPFKTDALGAEKITVWGSIQ